MQAKVTPHGAHETHDVPIRPLLWAVFALGAGCVLALLLVAWMFGVFEDQAAARDVPGHPLAATRPATPPPRLQVNPGGDMGEYSEAYQALLHTYGWIDREAGLVRLPVERAAELLLREGLPARGAAPPDGGREGGR